MRDPSLQSMPVTEFVIIELVKMSEDGPDVVSPGDDPRMAMPVAKSLMTQLSQETLAVSEKGNQFVSRWHYSHSVHIFTKHCNRRRCS